jgi:hypothetical protein
MRITKTGLYFDVPCDDYFADPCPEPSLSNSGIGLLLHKSPQHFAAQHPRLNGGVDVSKATAGMHRGSAVHRLALGAGKDYVIVDADSYRTKEAKAARDEAEEQGKCPILAHIFEEAQEQAKVVRQHLDDALLGGYDTQDAWYSRGLGHVTGEAGRIGFITLFCENDPPFASHAVTIDEAWRSSSWDLCEEAAEIFARCLKAKQWPGYPREPQLLNPPDWLISQRMFRGFARDGHGELDDSPCPIEATQ